MLRLLKMRSSGPILALAGFESLLLLLSFYVGLMLSWVPLDDLWVDAGHYLPRALIYTALLLVMMFATGLYHPRYFAAFADLVIRLSVGMALGLILLSAIFYVLPELIIWRSVMSPALPTAFFAILASRFVLLKFIDRDLLKRHVLVIGAAERASKIEALERSNQAFGFVCVGYVPVANENIKVPSAHIIPPDVTLENAVQRYGVDEIVIAVKDRRGQLPMDALMKCRAKGTAVIDYLSFYERETGSVDLDAVNLGWFLFSGGFPIGLLQRHLKRALDITVSLAFLIFFLPLIVLTAIAIRLESRGPVILRQTRIGYDNRPFVLLKFRSMRMDAESDGVARWALANDPRTTVVGAFIRRFRIDEIPQIFNVLRGDMSFVGPRPERPFFVEQLSSEIPFYGERHRIKPGITGWAQLNFSYGASVEDARMKLQFELYYVKYCSLLLDLVIIIQTIRVILWPQGAR